ncbi:MAG: glycosyltransferase [Crocinitomicaceae bacterium]|nr:TIGR04282 family arsenosugar biosynthesis glycosyltransferase [Flavobacteriales bacterium]NQZ37443.1 glycosyltransferase [Crocinitomicaceae bacterium]
MSEKRLLLVFVKNAVLGTAKTRLAKTIGNDAAFDVYKHLMHITEQATIDLKNCDVHIYFSSEKDPTRWTNYTQYVQQGNDLGERMSDAFRRSFELGYEQIVGVGSDLPDLTSEIIDKGLAELNSNDAVFGPAEDGGYYLIGMRSMLECIFEDKPWSTEGLLDITLEELKSKGHSVGIIETLNDVDTEDDLMSSSLKEWYLAGNRY